MFKKVFVSLVLGVSLLTSLTLWAESEAPTVQPTVQMAQLNVEQQLSLSAHVDGDASFLNQVGINHKEITVKTDQKGLSAPVSSIIWTMLFALLFFVVKATAKRIN